MPISYGNQFPSVNLQFIWEGSLGETWVLMFALEIKEGERSPQRSPLREICYTTQKIGNDISNLIGSTFNQLGELYGKTRNSLFPIHSRIFVEHPLFTR